MKKIIVATGIILSITVLFIIAYNLRIDRSATKYDKINSEAIETLNNFNNTINIDGHYFDDYLTNLHNRNYINLDEEIPYNEKGYNTYIYNIDNSKLTNEYFMKLVDLVKTKDNTVVFLILGSDYSFFGDFYSIYSNNSSTENNYLNTKYFLHKLNSVNENLQIASKKDKDYSLSELRDNYYYLFSKVINEASLTVYEYYREIFF